MDWLFPTEDEIETINLMVLGPGPKKVDLVKEFDVRARYKELSTPRPRKVSLVKRKSKQQQAQDNKARRLMTLYQMTTDQYDERLAAQGGGCFACGSTVRLVVDHDHQCCPGQITCGKCVRGILCDRCNRTLGLAMDDRDRLTGLVNYLGAPCRR